MASRDLVLEKNVIYHVYNRSTERMCLFRSIGDYHYFMGRMLFLSEEMKVALPTWSILPTHYHMMAMQNGEHSVSKFIQRLCTAYAMYFNRTYERSGHLFERSFKAKEIKDDHYFARVHSYIENNPIRHELVTDIRDWPYTSANFSRVIGSETVLKNDLDELEEMEILFNFESHLPPERDDKPRG